MSELETVKDADPTSEEVCTGCKMRGRLTDTDSLPRMISIKSSHDGDL